MTPFSGCLEKAKLEKMSISRGHVWCCHLWGLSRCWWRCGLRLVRVGCSVLETKVSERDYDIVGLHQFTSAEVFSLLILAAG